MKPMANELRVEQILARVELAKFTGESDKAMVPGLYKSYVKNIASVLQRLLGSAGAQSVASQDRPAPPSVTMPTEAPVLLADGQLLLQLADANSRRVGGEGAPQLGTVRDSRLQLLAGGNSALSSIDGCSQVVLPWRRPI